MATTVKIKDYDGVQRSYAVNKGIRLANADGTGFETFTQDGGGSNAALLGVLDGTVTQLTAQDLAGLTELAPYSLQHLQNLYSLELPSGFLTVGESACDSIATLSTVIFPASLTTVDSGAFMYTSIASVVLGDSVTNISHYALWFCLDNTCIVAPAICGFIGIDGSRLNIDCCQTCTALEKHIHCVPRDGWRRHSVYRECFHIATIPKCRFSKR